MATVLADVTSSEFLDSRGNGYAEEWAAYKQALARVIALDPERLSMGAQKAPLHRLDEAAVALCNAAWEAGAVVGDAFARAERGLESERRICPTCDGDGQLPGEAHARIGGAGGTCLSCGGRGTVPFGGGGA